MAPLDVSVKKMKETYRNRETEEERKRETEKQRNRETEKQKNRETEKQRNRETEKQRDNVSLLWAIKREKKIPVAAWFGRVTWGPSFDQPDTTYEFRRAPVVPQPTTES